MKSNSSSLEVRLNSNQVSGIKLIVGLANPGSQYQDTRHNAGAWYVQELARCYQIQLKSESKFHALVGKGLIGGYEVKLLIPTTFMNLSGKAIQAVANFYKIQPEEILVAHDELDVDAGTLKLKKGGGHGGHNGLRDTISKLGNNKDFLRLRVGIGHPGHKSKVTGYVLNKPTSDEKNAINIAIDEAVRETETLLKGDWDLAVQRLHSLTSPLTQ